MNKFRNAFVVRFTTTESIPHLPKHSYLTGDATVMSRNREYAEREARRLARKDLANKANQHWDGMGGCPIMDSIEVWRGDRKIRQEWL